MKRFGILLDSGAVLHLPARSRIQAVASLVHWRESRRIAIDINRLPPDERQPLVIPRRAIGLVIYRSKS